MRRAIIALFLTIMLVSVVFVLGQDNTPPNAAPPLEIKVSYASCALALAEISAATPEATAETPPAGDAPTQSTARYPVLTLGDDCGFVTPLLYTPSNGLVWVELALPGEIVWQQFRAVEDDEHPPQFDRRGRFIGCTNPTTGDQTCRALWDYDGVTYLIELPLRIGSAYTAPTPVPISTPAPSANTTGWGECGSCTTCGGPVEHCVLSPDNACLWDAARCEPPLGWSGRPRCEPYPSCAPPTAVPTAE